MIIHCDCPLRLSTVTAQYFSLENVDFQSQFNGRSYSGNSDWSLVDFRSSRDLLQGDGAEVTLQSADDRLQVTLKYLLYPNLPVVRKSLTDKNLGKEKYALEAVDLERFSGIGYLPTTFSWMYSDYGRCRTIDRTA